MNASTEAKKAQEVSLMQSEPGLLGHYLGGRRGLVVIAVIAVGIGLYSSWGWLAAVGVAPLLLALAPCAAMCALGLCMNKGGQSCSTDSKPADGKGKDGK